MINLVSLVVAAALVSLQCSYEASAAIEHPKIISKNIESNELPPPRRRLGKFLRIAKPPPSTVQHEGGALILECEAHGRPAPTVTWLKNGIPMSDFEEDTNEVFSVQPMSIGYLVSKLVIPSPENGDVYSCVANSGASEKVASTTVFTSQASPNILASLLGLPPQPIITAYFSSILQLMGTSVTLPCRTYSTSESQLVWLVNDEPLFENQRIKVLPSGDLHINGLVWEDMGGYTCTVKNMYGEDTMTTFLYPHLP